MRRWIGTLLAFCMILQLTGPTAAYGAVGNTAGPGAKPAVEALQESAVAAEGAVLMDANSRKVIFAKNADTRFYPASITKIMTALLVLENCAMDEMVEFRSSAVDNLESGSVSLDMTAGDKMSVKDCLYAMMLKSANEVANALAEHVSGSIEAFTTLMTERAKAMGCQNTNFANPNGLNNSNHYTTAYDMALIASNAFQNQTLCQIASTLSYEIPATIKCANPRTVTMGHKMLYPADSRYYAGIVAGKTGYTSLAGNTLVTCVERDGVRLVAVVLKSKQTHYDDTKAMLDYGFQNASALGLMVNNQNQPAAPGQGNGAGTSPNGPTVPGQGGQTNTTPNQPTVPGQGNQVNTTQNQPSAPGQANTNDTSQNQPTPGQSSDTSNTASSQNPQVGAAMGWAITPMGWCYKMDSGDYARNQWIMDGSSWYYFNETAWMLSGGWHQVGGIWYYFDTNGKMLSDTTTPDGYHVGADGAWVQ